VRRVTVREIEVSSSGSGANERWADGMSRTAIQRQVFGDAIFLAWGRA
jgi:hypothetical protein